MDNTKQKFGAEFKNKRFKGSKCRENFVKWLTKMSKYKIEFVDNGQDCTGWWIDEGGEVLHAVLQSSIWNGKIVDLKRLKVGKEIGVISAPREMKTIFYDFIVKSIKKLK